MNRLQRYIFGEAAVAVGLGVGLFMFVFVSVNVLRDVLPALATGQLTWGEFFEGTALQLPGALPYTMPVGILAGVLIVLGRFSAQSEIVAMKAAGMSLWRIVSPIFFIALVGVVLAVFINFEFAPYANDRFKEMLFRKIKTSDPSALIVPGEFVRLPGGTVIYADRAENKVLKDVWIWDRNKAGKITHVVRSDSLAVSFNESDGYLDLLFSNIIMLPQAEEVAGLAGKAPPVSVDGESGADGSLFSGKITNAVVGTWPVKISVEKFRAGMENRKKKLRQHTLSQLLELREKGYDLRIPENATPAEAEQLRYANRITVQLQIQNNLVSALGILSMTMVAIPLGIRASRSETMINLLIALMLMLVFYFLTVAMTWIKNPAFRPDILVWLPNFLFQAVGLWLLRKAARQ